MRRTIITGATGALGIALIHELTAHGVEVLAICRPNSPRISQIPNHPLVSVRCCDLADLDTIENDTEKQYDVFYHFGWEGTTGEARNNMHLQNRNVTYALSAVELAKRFGCQLFIGAGSQAEYGRSNGPLRADTPTLPENGYGYGKLCAGLMTRTLAHQTGMKHIWLRILSVYGPGDGAQSLIMSLISKLKKGETPECTKGEQQWDYLYSADAAKALRLIAERGIDGKVYVLGSGKARPLAEYIREIRDIVAPEADVAFGAIPYGPQQVMYLQADTTELVHDTGWKPEVPFSEGISEILRREGNCSLTGTK